jgi:hypothetical protein
MAPRWRSSTAAPTSRLQRLNAARQRGLGQVHRLGGAAEAAVFDHGDQMAQLAQLHA